MDKLIAMANPWVIVAALMAGLGLYMLGKSDGRDAERAIADHERVAALTRLIAEQETLAAQDRDVLTASEARRERIVTQFKIIEREVNRYALAHRDAAPCLDPDGLRMWWASARGDAAEIAAAQPGIDYRISGDTAGAGVGNGARAVGQLRPGGEALSPGAGADSHPGGLGHEPGAGNP